jgi:hypothetical protein
VGDIQPRQRSTLPYVGAHSAKPYDPRLLGVASGRGVRSTVSRRGVRRRSSPLRGPRAPLQQASCRSPTSRTDVDRRVRSRAAWSSEGRPASRQRVSRQPATLPGPPEGASPSLIPVTPTGQSMWGANGTPPRRVSCEAACQVWVPASLHPPRHFQGHDLRHSRNLAVHYREAMTPWPRSQSAAAGSPRIWPFSSAASFA